MPRLHARAPAPSQIRGQASRAGAYARRLRMRCRCHDRLDELLPEGDIPIDVYDGDSSVPEGFIDFRGIEGADDSALLSAVVARVVPASSSLEARGSMLAQHAIAKALQLLIDRGVIGPLSGAIEWSKARTLYPDGHTVRRHVVLGQKHAENGAIRCWKARVVAAGNWVYDVHGLEVNDSLPTTSPTSLHTVRFLVALSGIIQDPGALQMDVEAAYLHDPLDCPVYHLELGRIPWPEEWHAQGRNRPILKLFRAISGLRQSGAKHHGTPPAGVDPLRNEIRRCGLDL